MIHFFRRSYEKSLISNKSILSIKVWKIFSIGLIASALPLYGLYQNDGGHSLWMPPTAITLFSIGFYLARTRAFFLSSFTMLAVLGIVLSILGWSSWALGWQSYVFNSSFATMLANITGSATVFFLKILGMDASYHDSVMTLPEGSKITTMDITNSCSGLGYSILFVVAYLLILVDLTLKTKSLSKKRLVMLFLCGISATFLVNILRVLILTLTGYFFGFVAEENVHSYIGYIMFLALIGIFWQSSFTWLVQKKQMPVK